MKLEQLSEIIKATFIEIYERDGKRKYEGDLSLNPVLLETGMDSLGFAVLVTQLEDKLDFDPFSDSDDAFYPTYFDEFVNFYFENQK